MIPIIIVDAALVDRMVANKRISKISTMFDPIFEYASGDEFLSEFQKPQRGKLNMVQRPLILMDINVPGRDGFETVEELALYLENQQGSAAVIMSTSPENRSDIDQAESLKLVKGYIVKPFASKHAQQIAKYYNTRTGE